MNQEETAMSSDWGDRLLDAVKDLKTLETEIMFSDHPLNVKYLAVIAPRVAELWSLANVMRDPDHDKKFEPEDEKDSD